MNQVDFYSIQYAGRTYRCLSLHGLNKVRLELGMPAIPSPTPGEDPKIYKDRIRPFRKEALQALKTAPLGLGKKLFGEDFWI